MTSKQQQFVFVNGPALPTGSDAKSRHIRSALIRRRISEKQTNFRREEAVKRERLIHRRINLQGESQKHAWKKLCSCWIESQNLGSGQTQMSRSSSSTFLVTSDGASICGTCSGWRSLELMNTNQEREESPSSLSTVGGRMDPFSPLDASFGPEVDSLVHFALTSIWPGFRQSDYAGNCYRAWLLRPSKNQLLIYTTLWGASYHRDVLRMTHGAPEPVLETKEQLYYKGCVLRALHSHIPDYENEDWRDSIIMAVLYLTINDHIMEKVARDASPFTPPFLDLQSLAFYGSRKYHSTHWNFIQTLLDRLGGIHSINLYGLGWLLSIADLMFAAQALTKPRYPLVDVEGNVLNLPSAFRAFNITLESPSLSGPGFRDLLSLTPPIHEDIVDVFLHLGEFSSIVELYCNRDLDNFTLDLIADIRNQVHHRLFSLPDEHDSAQCIIQQSNDSGDGSQSLEVYHTCRLSALLYAVHVTFPVPKSSTLRTTLLSQLVEKLHDAYPTMSYAVLLWCTTVAAIAAEGMIHRQPLVLLAEKLRQDLQIQELTQFTEILRSFAWVGVACLDGFYKLWDEMMRLS
ncbi:hypothetical protein BDV28DRAFT_2380 [Aspergillus coremiiformis]|uniref:Uncharacterized protein n=1 Tax=Aspergillus coremiiformis TaxID=138285 RepID=A0A5N6ZH70_9EURO|nr:hypothetical protein BDV28DRAFT_2380 [Aspergillus coremiiformis]